MSHFVICSCILGLKMETSSQACSPHPPSKHLGGLGKRIAIKFVDSLDYILSSTLAWATLRGWSSKQTKKPKNKKNQKTKKPCGENSHV